MLREIEEVMADYQRLTGTSPERVHRCANILSDMLEHFQTLGAQYAAEGQDLPRKEIFQRTTVKIFGTRDDAAAELFQSYFVKGWEAGTQQPPPVLPPPQFPGETYGLSGKAYPVAGYICTAQGSAPLVDSPILVQHSQEV